MNCKPGDLAIVVKSFAGNEGKLVTCLRQDHNDQWRSYLTGRVYRAPTWIIDRELVDADGHYNDRIEDSLLRPIRDPGPDAVDETLQRIPTPYLERA